MSVGLDVGSKTIKIIELEEESSGFNLRGSGIVGYQGIQVENIKDDRELAALGGIIKKLHKEAGISKKDINISLPESQVFTRTIRFPLLTDQEIASAVKWEAEQYIPIPVTEAVVQHKIIERYEKSNPPKVNVLLVAAPETVVDKYTRVVRSAGLNTMAVETELMSLVRALAPEKQTMLILDFGSSSTDIAIAKDGNLVFSRSIPTAGDAFTRAVSRNLGVDAKQAEEYKKSYGLSDKLLEGKVRTALKPVIDSVVGEVKKSIHFYQSEEKGEAPNSIILSGGSAGMQGLVSYLTQALNMEVVMGNPFSKVKMSQEAQKTLVNYAPLYSIAVGLAMRKG